MNYGINTFGLNRDQEVVRNLEDFVRNLVRNLRNLCATWCAT
jgi:hypothetical protein